MGPGPQLDETAVVEGFPLVAGNGVGEGLDHGLVAVVARPLEQHVGVRREALLARQEHRCSPCRRIRIEQSVANLTDRFAA